MKRLESCEWNYLYMVIVTTIIINLIELVILKKDIGFLMYMFLFLAIESIVTMFITKILHKTCKIVNPIFFWSYALIILICTFFVNLVLNIVYKPVGIIENWILFSIISLLFQLIMTITDKSNKDIIQNDTTITNK